MSPPRTADELRAVFLEFFAARGHSVVPSASLIPHDPTVLFTVAGMVPFKPYFVGDEVPPHRRVTDVQKCARAGGKHNDLDRFDRVLGSAEAISANVAGASRVTRMALSTPVIKTVALASGTSRAASRLRRRERAR